MLLPRQYASFFETTVLFIIDKLQTQIDESSEMHDTLYSYLPSESDRARRVVLGEDVMNAVWADMKLTQLPSWISPAPPNWGTAKRGKLSADNWRVICTIHLPITLIRLWGREQGRKQQLLQNFMDLVSAVRIANMHVSSKNQIDAYNTYIFRYIAGLKELYPDESIAPTHHTALHLGDIQSLFGPVHSHTASFYERYINFFHRLNTNKKIGSLFH